LERLKATGHSFSRRRANEPVLRKALILVSAALLTVVRAAPKEIGISSGENNTPLLELFTSEGCSSCPPAEEWLSRQSKSPELWKRFVPVAFHVDYWNYLGWTDPYSSPEWSARQRDYSRVGQAHSVYTPGFFLNGREWRIGESLSGQPKVGVLKLKIREDGTMGADFSPVARSSGPYLLAVAPLACGVDQRVQGGENAGKTLHHDFVALTIVQAPMKPDSQGRFTATICISPGVAAEMKAVAAWVTHRDEASPIQAAGGWTK